MNKSKNRNVKTGESSLRIVGGQHRGRKLPVPVLDGLRPTADRVRETLFNWLQFDVANQRVLDLFAGTGALGFESLSRMAAYCTFVEPQGMAVKSIEQSLATLGHTNAAVQRQTAEAFMSSNTQPYQLVFVDPPFALRLWDDVLQTLATSAWCEKDALIYVEAPKNENIVVPDSFSLLKDKSAGQVRYRLFQKQ